MDMRRYEYARQRCIERLPKSERKLFTFVEERENSLADQAHTENQFVQLLQQNSPIIEAAEEFDMNPKTVYECVQFIEKKLMDQATELAKKMKLIDYTDAFRLQGLCPVERKAKYYFFIDQ
ncbi:hypothetical protein LGQ02_05425 [Bacillus shivajii]|uniref:hypothetical protein n=1 Tax=Bacillus shivajii TaxID=1983719 RepID=UPI001CFA3D8B|nr:hypothetical protein [Bacillus shivajii]UCZ54202.1 hypothetical protein LGQ02_05425 [Bacillus shivajii]